MRRRKMIKDRISNIYIKEEKDFLVKKKDI